MVQLIIQWLENRPQLGKIHHPPTVPANIAADMNFDSERMAVYPGTFVTGRHIRQVVCSFHLENSEDIHRRIVPIWLM